jgi:hypothetical protein
LRLCTLALAASLLAGCAGSSNNVQLASYSQAPAGTTIAFETIDGPPPEVFNRLVAALNDEASARRIAVVSRAGPAAYRVRGYLSALVEGNKTSFAWVWDLYDTEKRRALRLAGEEPAARAGQSGWAGADDQILRRMARDGMERLAAFLGPSEGSPSPSSPEVIEPDRPTLVSLRDDSPEAAGIVRRRDGEEHASATPPPAAARVGRPPRRAAQAAKPRPAMMAAATPANESPAFEPHVASASRP